MNTTFLTWLAVAAVVGGALLLFLGLPGGQSPQPLVLEDVPIDSAIQVEKAYWEPVTASATRMPGTYTTAVSVPITTSTAPCNSCGVSHETTSTLPASLTVVRPPSTAPCSSCGSRHALAPASPCEAAMPTCSRDYVHSCTQRPSSPCASGPCSGLPTGCGNPCGSTCPLDKPGINRNMDLCVDECTFLQLHTTIPYPICQDVCFEWTTSKGSFLDPTVADPIYYVPTTHFVDGEDVWVVVKITDGKGNQYVDQLKLHIVNVR